MSHVDPLNTDTAARARRGRRVGASRAHGNGSRRRLRRRQDQGARRARGRPQAAGMYIGSTGAAGLHHLVYEVVDNSIDEALAGFCDQVNVTIHIDNSVTVVDNGRGIPVDMHETGKSAAEVVLTMLHAGGKFDNDAYKVSGGLHGVGVSVVNALSERLELEIWRDGKVYQQSYERGKPDSDLSVDGHDEAARHEGHVQARRADLRDDRVQLRHAGEAPARARLPERRRHDHARRRARRQGKSHQFHYEGGIREFVTHLNKNKAVVNDAPIYMQAQKDRIDVEIALQYNDGYTETVYTFANNINTHEGGTHLSGFRSALTRTINAYATANNLAKDLKESVSGDDIREGLVAIISVKIPQPQFEGQTKTKLGNTEVKGIVETDRQREARRRTSRRTRRSRSRSSRRQSMPRGRARPRARRATRPPQGRARQQHAARQAGRLPGTRPGAERDLHRRGRIGRRLREAGPRPALPGDPAAQGQDPERREGALRQDARQRGDPHDDHGARQRHRRGRLRPREAALPPGHHHDRRRRRRLAHPHAAADVLLPPDARSSSSTATSTSRSRRSIASSAARAETYIKDDRELETYLIRRATESRGVRFGGEDAPPVSGAELEWLLHRLINYRKYMQVVERRGYPREIVQILLAREVRDAAFFSERENLAADRRSAERTDADDHHPGRRGARQPAAAGRRPRTTATRVGSR